MAYREEWIKNKKRNFENSISDIVSGVVNPTLSKSSKTEANIIMNWNKIFDESLRNKIFFKKLFCTDKLNNKFTLSINVPSKYMLEITYSEAIIKEQLAIFMGFSAIDRIKFHKI